MHGNPMAIPVGPIWPEDDGTPRNIFRAPKPDRDDPNRNEAFTAGGLLFEISDGAPDGQANAREKLLNMMSRLERRMSRAPGGIQGMLWKDNSPFNPQIPSGYTYLLQFIAHDMVDSAKSAAVASTPSGHALMALRFPNKRSGSLLLDTIYGVGPDECPHAYRLDGSTYELPRTALRLGDLRMIGTAGDPTNPLRPPAPPAKRVFCPFKDIARSFPPGGEDTHPTEAMVADRRNDAHALISQLTVLFHSLHNTILKLLPGPTNLPELAYRRFLCARFATTVIFRNIIAKDVLARILDPLVYAVYQDNPDLLLNDGAAVPAEFSAGAFRFGHAMVRDAYIPNYDASIAGLPLAAALDQSAQRNRAGVPVTHLWAVDWSLFFGGGAPDPQHPVNLSRRLGPFQSSGLIMQEDTLGGVQPAGPEFADRGLPTRDFMTSSYAGLWSVPALFREFKRRIAKAGLPEKLLPDYDCWRAPLQTWLKDYDADDAAGPHPAKLSKEEIGRLVDDPPLPFFVLFEAAHDLDAQRQPIPAIRTGAGDIVFPGNGGTRLGPLGSLIVGDVMFGALRSRPLGLDEASLSLRARIESVCEAFVEDPKALDQLTQKNGADRRLDQMLDLLLFLQENGRVFAA